MLFDKNKYTTNKKPLKGAIAHPVLRFLPKVLWLLGEALSPCMGALFRNQYESTGPKDLI